jgi:MinD-like ATPase involved in chromosome partitioning or flagellar assembly
MMAAGAPWESTAVGHLSQAPGIVLIKRCVDVDDLLASASSGQADAAVLALEAPGLDASAVAHLRRHGVRPVAVLAPGEPTAEHAALLGVGSTVVDRDVSTLPRVLTSREEGPTAVPLAGPGAGPVAGLPGPGPTGDDAGAGDVPTGGARVVVVWGPAGAPGRTTVAVTVAAELARRGEPTVLVDADPWGGSVAQQLGILDEASGLLSAARLAGGGQLGERFGSVCRSVGERLHVVTGLPRADRWSEVRPAALEQLVVTAAGHGHVVVDTGFSLEEDPAGAGTRPTRNSATLTALELADEIVVVGAADPVGLSRLARALVELRDLTGGAAVRVVVNRMRPSLGWSEKEIAGMVEGFARVTGLHFLPDDQAAADRALVSGRNLVEAGDSGLLRAFGPVVDGVAPATAQPETGRRRRRPRWRVDA